MTYSEEVEEGRAIISNVEGTISGIQGILERATKQPNCKAELDRLISMIYEVIRPGSNWPLPHAFPTHFHAALHEFHFGQLAHYKLMQNLYNASGHEIVKSFRKAIQAGDFRSHVSDVHIHCNAVRKARNALLDCIQKCGSSIGKSWQSAVFNRISQSANQVLNKLCKTVGW